MIETSNAYNPSINGHPFLQCPAASVPTSPLALLVAEDDADTEIKRQEKRRGL